MASLGISIDGGRFVRIESTVGDRPKPIRLRGLTPSQTSALLEFHAFRGRTHKPVKSVRIDGLQGRDGSAPELRLRAERTGPALWRVHVRSPGAPERNLRVRTGIGVLPVVLAAILILAGIFWFVWRPGDSSTAPIVEDRGAVPETSGMADEAEAPVEPEDSSPVQTESPAGAGGSTSTGGDSAPTIVPSDSAAAETDGPGDDGAPPSVPLPAFERDIVYFRPNDAELTAAARGRLDELLPVLGRLDALQVDGHCADYGTERGRLVLSRARAANVASYLRERLPDRVEIGTAAYGSQRPVTSDPDRQDENRRVEIRPSDRD